MRLYLLDHFAVQFSSHLISMCTTFTEIYISCPSNRTEQFVDLYKEFEPSLINSTVYIMSMAMQMATFAINYKVTVCP